jgi:Holliday junction resolvase RusA-like endonuclease
VRFILKGQIPSGKNAMQVTRTGHHYPLKRFTDWRSAAEVQIREQVGFPKAQEGPCSAVFSYWAGDLRRRDVPGMIDALFHLFERLALVKDDSLIQNVRWNKVSLDRENPRVEVEILS